MPGFQALPTIQDSDDDERVLRSSLELALRGCLVQLRTLRASQAAAAESMESASSSSSQYEAEEHALKLSLSGIIAQLQAVHEAGLARRRALLLSAIPQALSCLTVRDSLRLAQASVGVWAAGCARSRNNALSVPHLDAAPGSPLARHRFFTSIALGSVRTLALPAEALTQLLVEHAASLDHVEALVLPHGFQDFDTLLHLPCLQQLSIDATSSSFDPSAAASLAKVLVNLQPARLSLLFERLASDLATPLMDAVFHNGRQVHRVIFRCCVLPDAAVLRICQALLSSGDEVNECASRTVMTICFQDCELSDLAEQSLLAALEECDGRCVVTVDGGTTRTSEPADDTKLLFPQALEKKGAWDGDDASSDVRDVEIAELRAALAERDALLAETRAALAKRDARITDLEEQLVLRKLQEARCARAISAASSGCASAAEAIGAATSCSDVVGRSPVPQDFQTAAAPALQGVSLGIGGVSTAVPLGDLLALAVVRLQEEATKHQIGADAVNRIPVLSAADPPLSMAAAQSAPPIAATTPSPVATAAPCAQIGAAQVVRSRFGFALEGDQDDASQ